MRLPMIAVILALPSCGMSVFSDMPNLEDADDIRRALRSLNPIAPGSTSRDTGRLGLGQEGSDRRLFTDWMLRYVQANAARQSNIDYQPLPLPSSMAEAIAIQRAYEQRKAADLEARRAERERDDRERAAAAAATEQRAQLKREQAQREVAESEQRFAHHMAVYMECVRASEQTTAPQAGGIYPVQTCEQKRDAAMGLNVPGR